VVQLKEQQETIKELEEMNDVRYLLTCTLGHISDAFSLDVSSWIYAWVNTKTLCTPCGLLQILETKTRKLEQLVRLKDAKIDTLTAKLNAAGLSGEI
jgi:hypothetical protein